jgi:hypothetical protein
MNTSSLRDARTWFRTTGWWSLGAFVLLVPAGRAAEPAPVATPAAVAAVPPVHVPTQDEVRQALRAGDRAMADRLLEELTVAAAATDAEKLPAQRRAAEFLAAFAFDGYGGADHAASVVASSLLLQRAERAAQLEQAADRATVAALAGEVAERITGDRAAARRWYQAALRDDARQEAALLGLERLNAIEAAVIERQRDVAAARAHAAEQPPPPQPPPLPKTSSAK